MARRIHYRYHRADKPPLQVDQWLILERPDVKALLQDAYSGPPLVVGETIILEPAAPIVWFVFPERWYDIGRFHLADGTCTGWYTNLTHPVVMLDDCWEATDLFLDLWTPVVGDAVWLDQDELEHATRNRVLDRATRQRVDNERALIEFQRQRGAWPPQITRDIDLSQARQLRGR
ncbi:MAG TPA: DUF402 domain-containing protein [Gemmatimonadales bacterium]|nr:DUF402 domain-containing protein [Gemmatimonadales bacterium]